MDFLKKHYEKILLGVVLLGLVGAMVFLPFLILHDRNVAGRNPHRQSSSIPSDRLPRWI